MKKLILLFITLQIISTVGAQHAGTANNKKIHCHIQGDVKENTITRILLAPQGCDPRVMPVDTIWVKDGCFEYDLYTDAPAMYEMFACEDYNNGMWMTLEFFAEEGDVYATFHGYAKNDAPQPTLRSETPLNKELLDFRQSKRDFYTPLMKEKDSLEKAGKMLTAEGYMLKKQFDECQNRDTLEIISERLESMDNNGSLYTPEYTALMEKSKSVQKNIYAYELDYIRNNPTPVGLYLLVNNIFRLEDKDDAIKQPYIEVFERIYEPKYPTNAMCEKFRNWITSQNVCAGAHIIDFTLPDLNGEQHTLSEEIEGKVAIIDFWASWCGPCRHKAKSLIPIYSKYKERGLVVVGVASELEREDMRLALEKDGYPWLNLIALRGANDIWERYGIKGGGEVFLVDKDGTIISIGASAGEIDAILEKKLSKNE